MKRISRNMYLYDLQFKILHPRVATNTMLSKMHIIETENCEVCGQIKTIKYAIQNDKVEIYEYKWEKYITHHNL